MVTYTADTPTGRVSYVDHKRWLWAGALVYPLFPFTGIALHAFTGSEWWFLLPIAMSYLLVPLMDALAGQDRSNPPEAVVPALEQDRYYRWLTYATVPMHFLTLIGCAWWAATQPLSVWGFVALAVTAGLASGLGINTGHELGHKKSKLERALARIVLAAPAYGHFAVEHNRGHHRYVATPADPASARMGESIYRFALREMPGGVTRAWQSERERLQRKGVSVFSLHNEILQSYAITAVLQVALLLAFGWLMLPFLLLHNFFAWWQLTSANYIEHYGLKRSLLDNGRYERCQPWHSWNSNHVLSNLLLFHLQRHSDHHAHPTRRYQSLRNFADLPALPSGYYGMFVLAYVPAWFFHVMDRRLLNLKHINGDLSKVNLDPARAKQLEARYGNASFHKAMPA